MLLIIGPHKDTYKWQFLKISNMQHFKNEFSEVHTKLKQVCTVRWLMTSQFE